MGPDGSISTLGWALQQQGVDTLLRGEATGFFQP
jgi:hypothetical protein